MATRPKELLLDLPGSGGDQVVALNAARSSHYVFVYLPLLQD